MRKNKGSRIRRRRAIGRVEVNDRASKEGKKKNIRNMTRRHTREKQRENEINMMMGKNKGEN